MEVSNMKNMIVLRNLPSNLVEEAFVVLKANKKIKKLETIENNKKVVGDIQSTKDKEYMFKEAEMLVSDYVYKMENKEKLEENKKKEYKKIKKLKKFTYISTVIAILEGLVLFIM